MHRNKIAYRGSRHEVVSQSENKYQITYKRKTLTLMVDAFSGSVSR
tara:strand:+ start:4448 stop:4585 length:138 start_codon:yes stop_codon:yes gene_type:complete